MKNTIKKYFIPHEENDYKPHFFREWSVLIVATVIIALFLLGSLFQYILVRNSSMLASVISSVVVDLSNTDREKNELAFLSVNEILTEAAQLKANDMAEKSYFSHNSPTGITPWYWFKQAGYNFRRAGENLAVHFSDSIAVERAWMNSPTHRANILNENFTEVGVATAEGVYEGRRTTFVVQLFGQPASVAAVNIAVINEIKEESGQVLGQEAEEVLIVEENFTVIEESETFVAVENPDNTDIVAGQDILDQSHSSMPEKLIASPQSTLTTVLSIVGIIVSIALILMIVIEIRRQHIRHIVYGLILLTLLFLLIYINQQGLFVADLVIR